MTARSVTGLPSTPVTQHQLRTLVYAEVFLTEGLSTGQIHRLLISRGYDIRRAAVRRTLEALERDSRVASYQKLYERNGDTYPGAAWRLA